MTAQEYRGGGSGQSPDPTDEYRAEGGPEKQQQEWPGSDAEIRPRADHREENYRGPEKLEGRRALITGGDSGIGRAVAIAFARGGADVAIASLSEADDAADTIEWIEKAGRRALALPGDLSDPEQCREVVRRAATDLGGLDLLVNNHAVHWEQERLEDISDDQLERTVRPVGPAGSMPCRRPRDSTASSSRVDGISGVQTGPGATQFTRIFPSARLPASDFVNTWMAPLVAA